MTVECQGCDVWVEALKAHQGHYSKEELARCVRSLRRPGEHVMTWRIAPSNRHDGMRLLVLVLTAKLTYEVRYMAL